MSPEVAQTIRQHFRPAPGRVMLTSSAVLGVAKRLAAGDATEADGAEALRLLTDLGSLLLTVERADTLNWS